MSTITPSPRRPRRAATLRVRVGQWFEANATGWGVVAIPLLLGLVLAAAIVQRLAR